MKRTNRILPVYSADISGVCSALYELGGMTVMHDASGCNSTYTTHDEPRWYSMDSMVYISALSELEAVMGDDGKLVRDIVDAAKNLHPRFICMGGTPIPMMMGTDFNGIARMIEKETGIPTFGIATNGMHSYVRGAGEALARIAKRFCPSLKELVSLERQATALMHGQGEDDSRICVNILGATPLDFSLAGNVSRMKDFLHSHGMETVGCWAMESSLDEIRLAGLADVNLVVSAAGLLAARALEEIYGTPYAVGTPVGCRTAARLAGLLKLCADTGKCLSLFKGNAGGPDSGAACTDACESAVPDAREAVRRDISESAALSAVNLGIRGLPGHLAGERVLVVGEQVIAGSLRCSLREDFGADQVRVLCPAGGEAWLAEDGDMLVWDEDEVISAIADSTVVIADPLYRQVCPEDGKRQFVDFPHEACSGRMYHDIMKPFVCGE